MSKPHEDDRSETPLKAPHSSKKPRLMAPPEGFHKFTSSSSSPSKKFIAAKFTSEFDKDEAPRPVKAVSFRSAHPPRFRMPASVSDQKEVSGSLPGSSTTLALALVTPAQPKRNVDRHTKRTTPISSYQPVVNSPREDASGKIFPLLQLPPHSVPLNKTTVPLKPLPPPDLQKSTALVSPKKDLKSISTTRVARATDPMTDGGHAELFSILLQERHHLAAPSDFELNRGVLASPEKGSRSKGSKYVRGGIAERASHILSRSQTAFSLWQRETENMLSTRRLTPDLRFRVTKILHLANQSERFRSPPAMRAGVALCNLLFNKHDAIASKEKRYILYLSSGLSTSAVRVSNVAGLEENRELYVWHPWYEIDIPVDLFPEILVGQGNMDDEKSSDTCCCKSSFCPIVPKHVIGRVAWQSRTSRLQQRKMATKRGTQVHKDRKVIVGDDIDELNTLSQQSASSDYAEILAAEEQIKTSWEKRKEKEKRFLQKAKKDLHHCVSLPSNEVKCTIQTMDQIYEKFILDYATSEDIIRGIWLQIQKEQQTFQGIIAEHFRINVESVKNAEKGQIKGMALAKKGCEDFNAVILSLKSSSNSKQ